MQTLQRRLHKYQRDPERLPRREITMRSIAIIALLERYKFLPTSFIVRLVEGNRRITGRHLQTLYHSGLINRFAFPRVGNPGEFHYYLDDARAHALLINHGADREALDYDGVKRNREKSYYEINLANRIDERQGQLMHLHHEVMISRFHFMLEMACKRSGGMVKLLDWQQGSSLWHTVQAPKLLYDANNNWKELDQDENLPHRPDAFFTIHFPYMPEGKQYAHFFYEADRKHTSLKKHNRKLRAHFHYIVKQKKHVSDYGIKRVRAVLIETIDMYWADSLREAAANSVVSGNTSSPLFWFTPSPLFTRPMKIQTGNITKEIPTYLERPDVVFKKVWASPVDNTLYSLFD